MNGDYYLNTSNGDVYLKASGSYTVQVNIKGPTGATGATGSTGATGATGDPGTSFSWRGEYSSLSMYGPREAVSFNGNSYMCVGTPSGDPATDTTNWQLMAAAGAAGATGPAGPSITGLDTDGSGGITIGNGNAGIAANGSAVFCGGGVELLYDGTIAGAGLQLGGLSTADPGVQGRVWIDTNNGNTLRISGSF